MDSVRPLRVVLADDEEMLRVLLRRLLGLVPDVELVGEAADGLEAVELVETAAPDLVLLDVNMPHLDGLGVAELIRSYQPHVRVLLHSGDVDPRSHARARALGLELFDKTLLHDTVALIGSVAARQRPVIEPLVLLALADQDGDGVLIVRSDGTIPFYNGPAAALLRLPVPAIALSLSTLAERVRVVDQDGRPRGIEQLPLARALADRLPVGASVVCEYVVDDSRRRLQMSSLPFFSPLGEFLGVGNYLSERG